MQIRIRKSAVRDLKRIDNSSREILHKAIMKLEKFPEVSNLKKLTNFEPSFRLRVGDFRILFDVKDDNIEIGRVLNRKESYRK